ncbi:MAG: hypothetical protein JXA13_00980 [Anaerolineales bacterium]|nr:hypothetical protein [Anaerolineales bacterium]
MKNSNKYLWILGCMGVVTILFVVLVLTGYVYSSTASAKSQSVVLFREPNDGDRLDAGQPVIVRALARDDNKITQMELWVDGQLVDAQQSSIPGGINPFPMLSTWYPAPGAHTLIVRAYNSRNTAAQTTITVQAGVTADQDKDGVPDEVDACPDIPGVPEDGCPAPDESDRDGDGAANDLDACPDEPGSPLAGGCPDADGDGVADGSDACPGEPGSGEDGCGEVADDDPVAAGDEPIVAGEAPDPEDDEDPEPGVVGGDGMDAGAAVDLEVEGYEFRTTSAYESIACYLRLGEEDPRRYEFASLGEMAWDIAAEVGGANSIRVLHSEEEPLQVSVECLGSNPGEEPIDLGGYTAAHGSEDWDGREQFGSSEGNHFNLRYRICSPSCEASILPAPSLRPILVPFWWFLPVTLHWDWDGNNDDIDGFGLSVSTMDDASMIDIPNPAMRSLDISDYRPACGETVHFQLYAYQGDGSVHSPMSNEQTWSGRPCHYTANVTFESLDAHSLPFPVIGPIRGLFWASNGTTTERLEFNACACTAGSCGGYRLHHGSSGIDDEIFAWIRGEIASCPGGGCASDLYEVPAAATISVPFDPGDDISYGAVILDCDPGGTYDLLFVGSDTHRIEDVGGVLLLSDALEGIFLNVNTMLTVTH